MSIKKLAYISVGIVSMFPFLETTLAQSVDPELETAVEWMYENELTRYDSVQEYKPDDLLTREQAAKFFVQFASSQLALEDIEDSACEFSDIANADPTLQEFIIASCGLGLFRGSAGLYKPFDNLTKAEALTVLVRGVSGVEDETISPWRYNYHKQARQRGFTREEDVYALDRPITRYEIALILYRARTDVEAPPPEQVDAQLDELLALLQQLGLRTE